MKRVMEPILVTGPFTPAWKLLWRDRTFRVESIMGQWYFRGKWWLDPELEGERRTYFRLGCVAEEPVRPARRKTMLPPSAAYSMPARSTRDGPITAPSQRILEVFQRTKEGVESWVLAGVID